jgi:hypothetical protein
MAGCCCQWIGCRRRGARGMCGHCAARKDAQRPDGDSTCCHVARSRAVAPAGVGASASHHGHSLPPTPTPSSLRRRNFPGDDLYTLAPAALARALFRRSPKRHATICFRTRVDTFTVRDANAEDNADMDCEEAAPAPVTPHASWRATPAAAVARRGSTPPQSEDDDDSGDDDVTPLHRGLASGDVRCSRRSQRARIQPALLNHCAAATASPRAATSACASRM